MANARGFFEQHLGGLYSWDSVVHQKPESLPELANGRRNPLGRYREQIIFKFGRFEMVISSPEDDPPLGWVTCHDGDGICEGPLDAVVWGNIGNFIKERTNGQGRRAAS